MVKEIVPLCLLTTRARTVGSRLRIQQFEIISIRLQYAWYGYTTISMMSTIDMGTWSYDMIQESLPIDY